MEVVGIGDVDSGLYRLRETTDVRPIFHGIGATHHCARQLTSDGVGTLFEVTLDGWWGVTRRNCVAKRPPLNHSFAKILEAIRVDLPVERVLVGLLWFYVWADALHIDVDV